MRLLQTGGLAAVVAQELLAAFFQNADIRFIPGLLEGKAERTAVNTLFTNARMQHAQGRALTTRSAGLAAEDLTSFPKVGDSPGG